MEFKTERESTYSNEILILRLCLIIGLDKYKVLWKHVVKEYIFVKRTIAALVPPPHRFVRLW